MAYKLGRYDQLPVMKLSTDKASLPGGKQVFRLQTPEGRFHGDILACEDENLPGGEALLELVMQDGRRLGSRPRLDDIRTRLGQDLARLDDHFQRLYNPPRYPVTLSAQLERLAAQVQERMPDVP